MVSNVAQKMTMNRDPTAFESKVYKAISKIPKGKFTTYKLLSNYLDSSPRAVGQALKRNPFAPVVPCHRVIASNFNLGGYHGTMNSMKKIELLNQEGIVIVDGIIATDCRHKLFTDFNIL